MEREAFARAWRYLSYDLPAKWAAILAAVGTGILYVALLVVLSLFADLAVNRGRIPAYRGLRPFEQQGFRRYWDSLDARQRQTLLEGAGLATPTAADLAGREFGNLKLAEQGLAWRGHVVELLATRVNGTAGAIVLPSYDDLTPAAVEAFAKQWQDLPDKEALLKGLQPDPEQADPEQVAKWAAADPTQLPSLADREYLWNAYLYRRVRDRSGQEAADFFWEDRMLLKGEEGPASRTADPELADRGLLSLAVRGWDQPFGRPVGWLARVAPRTWRARDTNWTNFIYYLTVLLTAAIVLALLRAALMFAMRYMAARATTEAATRLRRAVYHHTFRLGTLAVHERGPGEAVNVFTRHLEAVHDALYLWLTVLFREPVKLVLLLAFALLVNFWLALAFLLFASLVWLLGGRIAAYFRRQGRRALRRASEQLALIQESLLLMRLVKTYQMQLFNQSRVERQLARLSRAQLRRYRGEAIYQPVLVLLGTLAGAVLLYVAGRLVANGALGVATGVTLAATLISLYWPIEHLLDQPRYLQRGREGAVELFRFLDRPSEVGQVVGAEFLPPLSRELEFDRVSLREPGTNRMLLEEVSFRIQAGQQVGVIGPDETEKHALVYLIPRLLDPTSGEIRIDSHNLRWVTLDSLQHQAALVLQHNLVFNDTAANNIGCGDPNYTLPQIIEAAKVAHAHQFIQKLPNGYETPIGDLGHRLNLGEQYRVALARAILRDPAILILEEPLEPLDEETKALVDDTFARVLRGRTVLFLPHRISTIKGCDRLFLLHRGRLAASGMHRELLGSSELYRHLYYIEFNELSEQL
jgi:ATP-binding cassette, subfamily B, bacterial